MAGYPQSELQSIRNELQSIINELDSISDGIRHNYAGISNNVCAKRVSDVAQVCRRRLGTLNRATVKLQDNGGGGFR